MDAKSRFATALHWSDSLSYSAVTWCIRAAPLGFRLMSSRRSTYCNRYAPNVNASRHCSIVHWRRYISVSDATEKTLEALFATVQRIYWLWIGLRSYLYFYVRFIILYKLKRTYVDLKLFLNKLWHQRSFY